MGNKWNRIIKNVMYDISGLSDWSFRSYVDYNTKIKSLIDGRYFKTVPDRYDILVTSYGYIGDGSHRFYMIKQNKDNDKFPTIQLLFLKSTAGEYIKEMEITPAYIKDLDDFHHYFKYCMDYKKECELQHEYNLKKKALAEKKYVANSDDFENKIYNLFDNYNYNFDVTDISRTLLFDDEYIPDPYSAIVIVHVKDIDVHFMVFLSPKNYSINVCNIWINCDGVDFDTKEFSNLEYAICKNSTKSDIKKYLDLVYDKL